jgi:hypothetical protein
MSEKLKSKVLSIELQARAAGTVTKYSQPPDQLPQTQ